MSGHGNFSAINGPRPTLPTIPQPGEDIGVSTDKSVGGVNVPDSLGAIDGKEEAPLQKATDGAGKAGVLLRQLDVLLARAAESATKGIDATTGNAKWRAAFPRTGRTAGMTTSSLMAPPVSARRPKARRRSAARSSTSPKDTSAATSCVRSPSPAGSTRGRRWPLKDGKWYAVKRQKQ